MEPAPVQRKIIHCDCDCFYASVEIRDDPSLAGLPVAVGGNPERRGVITTCNYVAREYGVHSAMPSAHARAALPGTGDPAAGFRQVPRRLAPDPPDLLRLHRPGRTAVAGRGLPRREQRDGLPRQRHADRARDPPPRARRGRHHDLRRAWRRTSSSPRWPATGTSPTASSWCCPPRSMPSSRRCRCGGSSAWARRPPSAWRPWGCRAAPICAPSRCSS